ncbi:hypothetical protein ACIHJG_22340 [Streptomyces sp. NPDC052415]|uniref:hypothetical protein n=1 Tax=Streptomyces sp. NPDC052415 TaxID=3365690 RepID=UPI0037D8BA35
MLDVLHLVHGTQASVAVAEATRAAGVTATAKAEAVAWRSENSLTALQSDDTGTSCLPV